MAAHLINLLKAAGLSAAEAVFIGSIIGPRRPGRRVRPGALAQPYGGPTPNGGAFAIGILL